MKHILIGLILLLSCISYNDGLCIGFKKAKYQKAVIIKYAEGGWNAPQGTYVRVIDTKEIFLFCYKYLGEKGDTVTVNTSAINAKKQY